MDDKFSNFIMTFGAARKLLARAHEGGYFIEGLVLYASLMDGLLRIAIILMRQLTRINGKVDKSFISQNEIGPYYDERQIIKIAHNENVINKELKERLDELYSKRNKIIHRFFLTDLKYNDISGVLEKCEVAYQEMYEIVYNLEDKQIEKRVGMTRSSPEIDKDENDKWLKKIQEKIDPDEL